MSEKILQYVPNDYRLIVGVGLIILGLVLSFVIIGIFIIQIGYVVCRSYQPMDKVAKADKSTTDTRVFRPTHLRLINHLNSVLLFIVSPRLWNIIAGLLIFLLSLYTFLRPSSDASILKGSSGEITISPSDNLFDNLFMVYNLLDHPAIIEVASLLGIALSIYITIKRQSFLAETFLSGVLTIALGVIFLWLPITLTDYCLSSGHGGCEGASIIIIFAFPIGIAGLFFGIIGIVRSTIKSFTRHNNASPQE